LPDRPQFSEARQADEIPDLSPAAPERTMLDQHFQALVPKALTIDDLGWTREQAAVVRALFGIFAEDWDDPAMDVYDGL
jgi:hypothetical protein